jgi:hypothetical protein
MAESLNLVAVAVIPEISRPVGSPIALVLEGPEAKVEMAVSEAAALVAHPSALPT